MANVGSRSPEDERTKPEPNIGQMFASNNNNNRKECPTNSRYPIWKLHNNGHKIDNSNHNSKSTMGRNNKKSLVLPKMFCLKKSSSTNNNYCTAVSGTIKLDEELESLSANSLNLKYNSTSNTDNSTTIDTSTTSSGRKSFRNSFYQNVDEALSSLLWQPYEYQKQSYEDCYSNGCYIGNGGTDHGINNNNNNNNNGCVSSSNSTISRPSSSSEYGDLDDEVIQSSSVSSSSSISASLNGKSNKNSSNNNSSSDDGRCNGEGLAVAADYYYYCADLFKATSTSSNFLNSERTTSALMVNNLPHTLLSQSVKELAARDTTGSAPSRLCMLAASPLASCANATESFTGEDDPDEDAFLTETNNNSTACGNCESNIDANKKCSVMPVEVVAHNGCNKSTLSVVTSPENGLNSSTTVFNANNNRQQSGTVPSSATATATNLSSANVVGLPSFHSHHQRYASVPAGTTGVAATTSSTCRALFPQHPRNGSEPVNNTNQFRYNGSNAPASTVPKSTTILPTTTSTITTAGYNRMDQNLLISHLRSSSAPKMPTSGSSTTVTTTSQKNINANFYRAVPVNVVSAVPTIHCLNTFNSCNNGNNVSNVQIMPLNNNILPMTNNNNSSTMPIKTNNMSVTGSTMPIRNSTSTMLNPTQVTIENCFNANNNNCNTPTNIKVPSTTYINATQSTITNINRNNNINTSVPSQVLINTRPISTTSVQNTLRGTVISGTMQGTNNNNFNNQIVIRPSTSTISTSTNCDLLLNPQAMQRSNAEETVPNRNLTFVSSGTTTMIPENVIVSNTLVSNAVVSNSIVTSTIPSTIMINSSTNGSARTFTSTEAQTDDIGSNSVASVREQRRRERRERRHQRRLNIANHRHTVDSSTQSSATLNNDARLPDILNSHLPPPYTPPSNNNANLLSPNLTVVPPSAIIPNPVVLPPPHQMIPPAPPAGSTPSAVLPSVVVPPNNFAFPPDTVIAAGPIVQNGRVAVPVPPPPSGFRFPFPTTPFRRGRFSEDPPKSCCGLLSWKPGSLRWFIALIALVAVCCVLVGTALGAMRPAGRDHLTVSLLMIGVGIVLVTVSGVAWRLTSHDSSTCRSMLGLGNTDESVDVCTRRFVPRLPPSYGRPHHPYAAMMYPEFQYRPPPPSYQASMQEYRLRLLLLDRGNTPQIQAGIQNAVSPPPTYRSHAGSLLRAPLSSRRDATQSEYSCPPSYRSQNSSSHPPTHNSVLHSREHSLSLSESNNGGEQIVNVVSILGSREEDAHVKVEPENDLNTKMLLKGGSTNDLDGGSKDGNLVTIVQTSDQSPVIVTVSGASQIDSDVQITDIPSEMEILAHL